jgi:preprotein translocase subunit SecY
MNEFIQKLRLIGTDTDLRKKLLFVFFALVIFRLGANIPIPAVDPGRLTGFLSGNQFLGLLNVFSGGGLSNLSIFMLGVGPYITSSIIMQLLTMIFPKLREMYQEEGAAGRRKFTQYSRILTVPLAVIQGFGLLALLKNAGAIGELSTFDHVFNLILITAGSMLLMWIGELINEYGIGNGVSLIIFAGIVASLPGVFQQLVSVYDPSQIPVYLAFLVVGLLVIFGVVVVTEAERPIPITYAKRVRGMKMYGGVSTYLPLRINQAGVIPIIFALSILLFPQIIINFFSGSSNSLVQGVVSFLTSVINNTLFYGSFYFVLVFLFTYFYTAVTFDPDAIAGNLQKNGAFIPGVRPGQSTADYLSKILGRITFVGALFLGIIAVLPFIMQAFTQNQSLAIGGTGLLIVVQVVLDLIKRINAQVSLREY